MTQHATPIRIKLPTGLGVGPANAYLFVEPEPILVDCGIRHEDGWSALEAGLMAHGVAVSDLSRVVITHPHVDHFGQAGRIVAEGEAEVWIADVGAEWLLDTAVMWQQRHQFYREFFLEPCGFDTETIEVLAGGIASVSTRSYPIPRESIVTFKTDGMLQMGGLPWQVLHVPGHTYHQTCFYQQETKQLISADHLLGVTPTPVVEQALDGSNTRIPALPQFLQSLDLVERLEIEMVYPGHGRPFTHHRDVIQRQRERIATRKAEVLALIEKGEHTIPTLLNIMYAHHPPQFRFAGLWMLVGYLDLLKVDGRIEEKTINGVWHYYKKDRQ
ncbi:MAG: MBL fold metallo-hydrolase [Chloroflexi bacterium]|nr:MBL fold metallo-hydrolase [Chloroflexota bacterium]